MHALGDGRMVVSPPLSARRSSMSHHRLFLASLLSSTLIFAGACRDDHGDTTSKPTSDTSAATTDVGVAITDDGVATTDNGVAVTALSAAPSPPASTPQPLRLY